MNVETNTISYPQNHTLYMHKLIYTILLCFIVHVGFSQMKKVTITNFQGPNDLDMDSEVLFKMTALFEEAVYNSGLFEVIDKGWTGIGKRDNLYDDIGNYNYAFIKNIKDVDYIIIGNISGYSTKKQEDEIKKGQNLRYQVVQEARISLTIKVIEISSGRIVTSVTDASESVIKSEQLYSGFTDINIDRKIIDETSEKVVSKVILKLKGAKIDQPSSK